MKLTVSLTTMLTMHATMSRSRYKIQQGFLLCGDPVETCTTGHVQVSSIYGLSHSERYYGQATFGTANSASASGQNNIDVTLGTRSACYVVLYR
jgi:hypothetical protein